MSESFNVKFNYRNVETTEKYPPLPFVLMDKFNDLWMVVKDSDCDKEAYRLVSLTYESDDILNSSSEKGKIIDNYFDSLEELMSANSNTIIMEVELAVNGKW